MPTATGPLEVTRDTILDVNFHLEYVSESASRVFAVAMAERPLGVARAPSLTNFGIISAYSSSFGALAISVESGFWGGSTISNYGTVRAVSASGNATGIQASSWCPSILNDGDLIVEARNGWATGFSAYTPNVETLPFSFTNSGTISVTGNLAWGLYLLSSTLTNTGDLIVTGGAEGAFAITTARSRISNSGTIIAQDNGGPATSIAISFSPIGMNGQRDNDLTNSGLIQGDVAIAEIVDANTQSRITNTGEIRGNIDLRSGDDVVRNSGTIVGDVILGSGSDLYDARGGGRLSGVVSGGSDTDIAIFSGLRSAYVVSSANGVTTVRLSSGGEPTRLTGFERFRFDDGLFDASGSRMQELAIVGTAGDDFLQGTADSDVIRGMDGDDGLNGGVGDDTLDGGAGLDVAVFTGRSTDYEIVRSGNTMVVSGRDGIDTLLDIEALSFEDVLIQWGSTGNDLLLGTTGPDLIYGLEGDDIIDGIWGEDTLYGGEGDDTFAFAYTDVSGALPGLIDGETGFDTLDLSLTASVSISPGGDGSVILMVGAQRYEVANIERVIGRTTDNVRIPDADTFDFSGYDGAVELFGGGGSDALTGGDGSDLVDGGIGDDLLSGNAGNDILFGGSGADTLNGGADNDVLIGGAGNDAVNGGDGYDVAVYSGVRRAYAASALAVSGGVEGGTDTLTGIEDLSFTDGRLTFHRDGQAAQVMRLYDAAFNRSPDQSGFEIQLDTLENGSETLLSLAEEFVNSVEFQSQYGGLTNQQFVEQMYQFCLNRAGDAGGIQTWVNALNGGQTRAQVLLAFSESGEHKDLLQGQLDQGLWVADEQTLQIARLYDATYDRLPDQAGLKTWRDALGGGMSLEAIAQTFTTAPEFQAKYGALSNQGFVELMYQLCLNRNGDPAGIQTWVDALNGGTHTRGQVLLAFSESSEHIALTRPTWLGGVPTTDLPAASPDLDHGKDGGAQVLPAHADHGIDDGAQVVSGVDTGEADHGAKHAEAGPQVLPIVADAGADDGAQVVSGVDTGEAPQAKVVAEDVHDEALVLPGVIDDGFLLETKGGDDFDAQILPGAGRAEHAELTDAGADVDRLFDLEQLLTSDLHDDGGFHGSHHGGHDLDPNDLRQLDPWAG